MITYGKQSINQDDIDAVSEVLASDFLTQGPKVKEFESNLSDYVGAKFAKTVSNGTAALHLAYLALGIKENDIVWTAPITFVSTANAAIYCGAKVDFVDIDPRTFNLSISCLKEKLSLAKKDNKLPKLVVPIHFAGQSCEMKEIWELSQEYGFKIIEDACHALGGDYLDKKIGSCEYSDAAVFSFHPVKMITTGEGGAIVTNDKNINEKISILMTHGITKDTDLFINDSDGDWYYEQQELGFNYRLTDIQAALGVSQLKRLDYFVQKRRELANYYLENIKTVNLPFQHPDTNSSWHLFVIQSNDRDSIYENMKKNGISPQVHYIPVVSHPFHKQNELMNSKNFYKCCLSIPIFVDLTRENQLQVIDSL